MHLVIFNENFLSVLMNPAQDVENDFNSRESARGEPVRELCF